MALGLGLALTGCTHGEQPRAAASPSAPAATSSSAGCASPAPVREGPAALAVMRKSQRSGAYPYLRLSRGQQVLTRVPAAIAHLTVKVSGDEGVLLSLGQEATPNGVLLRYRVANRGTASIDASGTSGETEVHYVTGVTAIC
jgi:hypothetical protein